MTSSEMWCRDCNKPVVPHRDAGWQVWILGIAFWVALYLFIQWTGWVQEGAGIVALLFGGGAAYSLKDAFPPMLRCPDHHCRSYRLQPLPE